MKVDYEKYPQIPENCQLNVNRTTGITQVFRQYRVLDPQKGKKVLKRESVGTIKNGVFKLSQRWAALQTNQKLTAEINRLKGGTLEPTQQAMVDNVVKVKTSVSEHQMESRQKNKITYLLDPILLAGLMSALTGQTESTQIAGYFNTHRSFFERCFPDLPKQVLTHDIVYRAFLKISPEKFDRFYQDWIKPLVHHTNKRLVAADGQAVRASKRGLHRHAGVDSYLFMNVYDVNSKVCLAHKLIDQKTNEISVGPKMLSALDIHGAIVTADAMSCQVDFVNAVIGAGADFCLSLKGNQDKSFEEVCSLFVSTHSSQILTLSDGIELDHGRIEQRHYRFISGRLLSKPIKQKWTGLTDGSLVEVASYSQNKKGGQQTSEVRYYICSLPPDSELANDIAWAIRNHWAIENNLHGALDVNFKQDGIQAKDSRYLTNRVALNKLALSLIEDYRFKLWNSGLCKEMPSVKATMQRATNPLLAMQCLAWAQALT